MLAALLILFVVGNLKSQVTSPNGEFSYNYISQYSLVTGLGDTIHTNQAMPHGINDLGHVYSKHYRGVDLITIYYNHPWEEHNALFVEYYPDGTLKQSIIYQSCLAGMSFCYYSREKGDFAGLTSDKKYFKLIKNW